MPFNRTYPRSIKDFPSRLAPNTFRILSIDGGGARGMIPAVFLKEIERRSKKPISKLFDRICGTSTGAILASALSVPRSKGDKRPMFMAREIVEIYRKLGKEIFYRGSLKNTVLNPIDDLLKRKPSWIAAHPTKVIETISDVWKRLNRPLHNINKLAYFLHDYYGKLKMEDSLIEFFIYAYDTGIRTPQVLGSVKSSIPGSFDYSKYCIYQTVTASSASPPFFAPYTIWKNPRAPKKETDPIIKKITLYPEVRGSGNSYTLIDGGNAGLGNPSVLAALEETILSSNKSKLVLSLGTGHSSKYSQTIPTKSKEWGIIQWMVKGELLNTIFDGEADCVDMTMRTIFDKNVDYFRWQPNISESMSFMDEGGTEDMKALENIARSFISENDEIIDAFVKLIDR